MAQKIITLAQFKKLYHEKNRMAVKKDRQKTYDEMWESLPDYVEGQTHAPIVKK